MNEHDERRDQNGGSAGFLAALVRLERAAGVPVPSGSLRLWSAELHGELLSVARSSEAFFDDLARLREDIARNDQLRLSHVQRLEHDASRLQADLATLRRHSDRLGHSRHPESPIELRAANALRHDILAWVSETRALRRGHEEWQARSLQIDIGGPG